MEKLNELEYVHGELLANVWYSDLILRINPVLHWIQSCRFLHSVPYRHPRVHMLLVQDTGVVLGIINLTSIVPQANGLESLDRLRVLCVCVWELEKSCQ